MKSNLDKKFHKKINKERKKLQVNETRNLGSGEMENSVWLNPVKRQIQQGGEDERNYIQINNTAKPFALL